MRKLFTLALGMLVAFASFAQTDCSDLYFSEYIEGGSSNKALEIYNPSSSDINLSGYAVALFSNGGTMPTSVLYLKGTLASGDVYTIVNSSASSTLLAAADTTSGVANFNGDDAVVLGDASTLTPIDVIGEVGTRTNWTVGSGSTQDYTLVRMAKIKVGETDWSKGDDQWDVYNKDEFSYFGSHTSDCIKGNPNPNPGIDTIAIKDLRVNDTLGVSTYDGKKVWAHGVVNTSLSLNSGCVSISLQDNGWGISIFDCNMTYMPNDGDSVSIRGTIGAFNGLTQFGSVDSFIVHAAGAPVTPEVVTSLDEMSESKLVRLNRVWVLDSNDWRSIGSFNVDISNGTDTFTLRVDSDSDIDGFSIPNDTFDVIGVGGQFDSRSPYHEGYQILPRTIKDLHVDNYHVTIREIRISDANGISLLDGRKVTTYGIVNNDVTFNRSAINISFQDQEWGVGSFIRGLSYVPTFGDSVRIVGEISQFNGLCQFGSADTIEVLKAGAALEPTPAITLGEEEESKLVVLGRMMLVDSAQWRTSGSFNVDITNGIDTFAMRVDSDTDIDGFPLPNGLFDVVGIGGQFDGSAPHDEGYQIFPRSIRDLNIDNYHVSIKDIRTQDANGISLLDGKKVTTYGVVNNEVSFNSGAVNISFQDGEWGIGSFIRGVNYTPALGDSVRIEGEVGKFNGLTQFSSADTIEVLQAGVSVMPYLTTMLDETTESRLVRINGLNIIDTNQWTGSGSGFNVDVTNGTDTFTMRIDNDVDLYSMPAPKTPIDIIGIGGQFDSSEPHDEGYQVFPRSAADIIELVSTPEVNELEASVFPNPVSATLNIQSATAIETIEVFNTMGSLVKVVNGNSQKVDFSNLDNGVYMVKATGQNGEIMITQVVKH